MDSRENLPETADTKPTAIEPVLLLAWLKEAFDVIRDSKWGPLLQTEGIDLLDAFLNPLFLSLLSTARDKPDPRSASLEEIIRRRVRTIAFQLKNSLREWRASRLSPTSKPTEFLFWPRDRTHVISGVPVVRALRSKGERVTAVACHAKTFNLMRSEISDTVLLPALWPDKVRRARAEGRRLSRALLQAGPISLPPMPFAPSYDVAARLRETMEQLLPSAIASIVNAREALTAFRPHLLLVGNDLTLEGRIAAMIAREKNLPSACLMHGSVSANVLQRYHLVDRMLVYGQASADELIELGMNADQIAISGASFLDQLPAQSGAVHPMIAQRCHIRPGSPYILVATSGAGHRVSTPHHQELVAHVMHLTAKFPQCTFVAKLHPKDQPRLYAEMVKQIPQSRLRVVEHGAAGYPNSILDWLQGAAVLLTGASTTASEAMLLDVPVITMDFRRELEGTDFIDAGATTHIRTSGELEDALERTLSGAAPDESQRENVRRYLESSFAHRNGGASDASAAVLQSMREATSSSVRSPSSHSDLFHGRPQSPFNNVKPC